MAGTVKFYNTTKHGLLEIIVKGSKVTVEMPPVYGKVKVRLISNPMISDYLMTEEVELITDEEEILCLLQTSYLNIDN